MMCRLSTRIITTTCQSSIGTDSRNFMERGSPGGELSEGLDNLLERGREYGYRVQKIENGSIVTAQTYNQFHLLVEEARHVDGNLVHLKRLDYPALDNQEFSAQPAQYSLISKGADLVFWIRIAKLKIDSGTMMNTATCLDLSTRMCTEHYEYYAKNGETNCPASPTGMVVVKVSHVRQWLKNKVIAYQYASLAEFKWSARRGAELRREDRNATKLIMPIKLIRVIPIHLVDWLRCKMTSFI
ncbi:hypothetical protein OH492_12030 [Vibrio chagasii]|nr:hypothetical protein [Vibrio chagasii]